MTLAEQLSDLLASRSDASSIGRYLEYLRRLEAAGLVTKPEYRIAHPFRERRMAAINRSSLLLQSGRS